ARDTNITPRDIAQLSKILSETEETNNKVISNTTTTTATTHQSFSERQQSPPQTSDPSEDHKKNRIDSQEEEIVNYELSDENMELVELSASHSLSPNRQTTGGHRELPVDVPESFVGVVKQTPRYPPPHPPPAPPQRTSSQAPQNEKIRKYSEEISQKKAEEEFLRSSLRGSKKLQQLEHNKPKELEPVVNNAFEADDDDDPQLIDSDTNTGM
ncbi:unnamed protein product, partial [Medioppia subpectinata]